MGSVFCIEIIQIRRVLEVVGVYLSAFYHVVGLYVIGVLNDIQGNVFFRQDFLGCL